MTRRHQILSGILIAVLTAIAASPARAAEDWAPAHATKSIEREKDHKHVWVDKQKQEWVKPVTRKELVGYDQDGKPIYKDVIVQPGYWKTVTYSVCSICGKKKG